MNGKIKTKFAALFAVALMITVCVVPMVGGSEDVEAADPGVTIKGYVYNADGTSGIDGAIVYIGSTYNKDMKLQAITGDNLETTNTTEEGFFSIPNVPKGDITVNVVTNVEGKGAYGLAMPTITLNNVVDDVAGLEFVAGTVQISGDLVKKTDATNPNVYLEGISIKSNNSEVAKTDVNGRYSFLATIGSSYKLSATAGNTSTGITFESETFVAEVGSADVDLKATVDILQAEISAPVGSFEIKAAGSGNQNSVKSIGVPVFGNNSAKIYAYAKITYNAASTTLTTVSTPATFDYGYGIETPAFVPIANNTATGDLTSNFTSAVKTGSVYIGDQQSGVKVDSTDLSVSLVGTDTTNSSYSISAFIKWGNYYVGTNYSDQINLSDAGYEIVATFSDYTFEDGIQNGAICSSNHVVISGTIGSIEGFKFSITGTGVVTDLEKDGSSYLTNASGAYSFFAVKGKSVTITPSPEAGKQVVSPTSIAYSAVNYDLAEQNFDVITNNTYVGQILINGVSISLTGAAVAYSVDGGKTWADDYGLSFTEDDDGVWTYEMDIGKEYKVADILVKLKLDDDGKAGGYLFNSNADDTWATTGQTPLSGTYTAAVGITGTTIGAFNVKAVEKIFNVKDVSGFVLPEMEVSFVMKKDPYGENDVVADLGKATTDVFGNVKVIAAEGTGFGIFAVPSGECEYGEYTFASNAYSQLSFAANEKTLTGYYTDDGSELKGFGMSFIAKGTSGPVAYGDAKIIGNKYYIVAPSSTTTVDLKALDGFTIEGQGDINGYLSITDSTNIVASKVIVPSKTFSVSNMTNSEFTGNVRISVNDGSAKEGTVIVLSAEKTCYKLQDASFEYQYTDAAVEYKFAGWYVNGKLLTEDCDTAITLSENVVIVAQYDEAVKVIGSEDVPEAGLDTNVLILGIVVVVIALIAVVYSVISRRD